MAQRAATRYKPAMAMKLPLRPTPFFGNKNRAFWRLQFLGWGGAMLLRAMSSLANDIAWQLRAQ